MALIEGSNIGRYKVERLRCYCGYFCWVRHDAGHWVYDPVFKELVSESCNPALHKTMFIGGNNCQICEDKLNNPMKIGEN